MKMRYLAGGLVVCLLANGATAQVTLVSKPGGAAGKSTAFTNNLTPAANSPDGTIADDFTLTGDSTINSITWWGVNSQFTSNPNPLAFLSGFRVRIWSDDAGVPDALLEDQFIPSGLITSTAAPHPGAPGIHQYEAAIPTAFDLDGGTQYWISILGQKSTSSSVNIWAWQNANVSESVDLARFFTSSGWSPYDPFQSAMAFELNGIPAPGAFGLAAIAAIGAARRRRI